MGNGERETIDNAQQITTHRKNTIHEELDKREGKGRDDEEHGRRGRQEE